MRYHTCKGQIFTCRRGECGVRNVFEKPMTSLVFLDLCFVFILSLSGTFSGIWSTILYILAFLVPIAIGFAISKEKNKSSDFLAELRIGAAVPLIAPTLCAVILIAAITSFLILLITGKESGSDLGDDLWLAILSHAFLPALLEEALFRYIPMRVLREERGAVVILYTAVIFALIHHSFYSFLYAFAAGAVFMLVDLMCASVWPSVIIHFLNNLLSVLWYFNASSEVFLIAMISSLVLLCITSVAVIIKRRESYKEKIKPLISLGESRLEIPIEIWILAVPMLVLAVMELL